MWIGAFVLKSQNLDEGHTAPESEVQHSVETFLPMLLNVIFKCSILLGFNWSQQANKQKENLTSSCTHVNLDQHLLLQEGCQVSGWWPEMLKQIFFPTSNLPFGWKEGNKDKHEADDKMKHVTKLQNDKDLLLSFK